MIQTIIARKEGRLHKQDPQAIKPKEGAPAFRLGDLFKKSERYLDGAIRYLKTSNQNSPLGMALKGLRG